MSALKLAAERVTGRPHPATVRGMFSNGNSFSGSVGDSLGASVGNAVGGGEGGRWPVPPWKFGLRLSDDRGSI